MSQILKTKYFFCLTFLLIISCSKIKTRDYKKILVTSEGIPEVSIGDQLIDILNGSTTYVVKLEKLQSKYGVQYRRLRLFEDNEEIAYINYDENSLDDHLVSKIVCTNPRCITKEGLSIGMDVGDFVRIYQMKDTKLRGGINDKIGYFIPEILKKKNAFFTLSKIVIKLEKIQQDTIVKAFIVESG